MLRALASVFPAVVASFVVLTRLSVHALSSFSPVEVFPVATVVLFLSSAFPVPTFAGAELSHPSVVAVVAHIF